MIQIYGSPRSSAGRCYLILEELGIPYQEMPLDMMGKREHKSESHLKLNPNGKVPCIKDGDFVLWESLAINHYLVEKHKPELLGSNAQEKGLVYQWSTWATGELQAPLIEILIQMVFVPEDKRDMTLVARAKDKVPGLLTILDRALANKNYLLGDKLTLADFNMASVVNLVPALQMSLDEYTNVLSWFGRMKDRPSFQKVVEKRKG